MKTQLAKKEERLRTLKWLMEPADVQHIETRLRELHEEIEHSIDMFPMLYSNGDFNKIELVEEEYEKQSFEFLSTACDKIRVARGYRYLKGRWIHSSKLRMYSLCAVSVFTMPYLGSLLFSARPWVWAIGSAGILINVAIAIVFAMQFPDYEKNKPKGVQ